MTVSIVLNTNSLPLTCMYENNNHKVIYKQLIQEYQYVWTHKLVTVSYHVLGCCFSCMLVSRDFVLTRPLRTLNKCVNNNCLRIDSNEKQIAKGEKYTKMSFIMAEEVRVS
jgi:hypothetical protein